jgi:D-alanyl-D-alanine carboxypeptidase
MLVLLCFSYHLNTYADDQKPIDIKSEAAILLDTDTGAVLYAKNPDEKLYPASLTKIATAIYAIEKGNLNDIVTVSKNAVSQEGTRVYLDVGEKVPLKLLIQGMLINSGNDAAVAIAEHLDGNVDHFSENMNDFLKEKIGVKNTHFVNPNGLFNPNHYTTARDLAMITNYAKKNPVFSEIFGTKKLDWNSESWKTTLITHHLMLKGEIPYPGITGGKTGYVDESKLTLATTAENGNLRLTAIVLKAPHKKMDYNDTKELLDYGFNNFQHTLISHNEKFTNGNKDFFPKNDTLITVPNTDVRKMVNNQGILTVRNIDDQTVQQIQLEQKLPEKINKPTVPSRGKMNFNNDAVYGIIIFALAGIVVGLRKKIRRNL